MKFNSIMIDRDPYLLTFPGCGMLTDVLIYIESVCSGLAGEVDDDCFVYASAKDMNGNRYLSHTTLYGIQERREIDVPPETVCGWRPMLIPLDKNGKVSSCLQYMPNGKVITGGSFQYQFPGRPKQIFYSKVTFGGPLIDVVPDNAKLWIGDSNSDSNGDLQWVVWDGKLVCSRVLVRDCSLKVLADNNCVCRSLIPIDKTVEEMYSLDSRFGKVVV